MTALSDMPSGPMIHVLGGYIPGPTLVVDAEPAVLRELARKLAQIPSLPRMRGALVLGVSPDIKVDASLRMGGSEAPIQEQIWKVLAAAARLGMIAGRGVPMRYLDAAA